MVLTGEKFAFAPKGDLPLARLRSQSASTLSEAFLQDNEKLVDWVNRQPLATPLTRDGHDGIWNLFEDIESASQRQEILDHRTRKSP